MSAFLRVLRVFFFFFLFRFRPPNDFAARFESAGFQSAVELQEVVDNSDGVQGVVGALCSQIVNIWIQVLSQ